MVEAVTTHTTTLNQVDKLTVCVPPAHHSLDQMPQNKSDLCFFHW
jgi:hypothetical protein